MEQQQTLDFWVVTTQKKQEPRLVQQHKIDRLMRRGRQPYETELRELFKTDDDLMIVQPYVLWLCPSLSSENANVGGDG